MQEQEVEEAARLASQAEQKLKELEGKGLTAVQETALLASIERNAKTVAQKRRDDMIKAGEVYSGPIFSNEEPDYFFGKSHEKKYSPQKGSPQKNSLL